MHYISYFFSLILPGRIGGDLNRALSLMQLTDEKSKTIVIILIWRIIGMTSLFFVASIALFINVYMKKIVGFPLLFIGSVWIILIWLLFFLFVDIRVIVFILEKIQQFSLPFKRKIDFLFASLRSVLSKKDILIKNLVFSIMSHCTIIFCYYILSLSIKSDIPIFLFFIFTPIVGVIQQIPITIGGIGLREGSYLFLFIAAGKSPEIIISITLLYYIISLMIGAIGCCLLIFTNIPLKNR